MDSITSERVRADYAPWTAGDTAIGVILTLGPLIAFSLFSNSAAGNASTPHLTQQQDIATAVITFVLTAVLEGVFLIAPLVYARRRAAGNVGQALGFRGFNPAIALVLIILSYVVIYLAGNAIDALNTHFHITAPTNAQQLIDSELKNAPITLIATLVAATIVAPICEEIFFRSFLMQGLRTVMPSWLAVVFSALVFAIVHLSPGSFGLLLVLGILLGALRLLTRSVWPGIVLHALNNGFVLFYVITQLKK
ncbi:MAG: CPBP family intramembrane metalloprotease [Ktedonobacterales bacterium]|nr:CPBP family intramembrane metalloprotease [Ktedonobacterales bacterium]